MEGWDDESAPGRLPPMTLPVNNLARYLRTELGAEGGRLQWKVPRAILGIIPAGTRRVEVPVAEIAATRIGRAVRPVSFVAGLAGIAVPFFFFPWWAALPILLVGLWVLIVSLGPASRCGPGPGPGTGRTSASAISWTPICTWRGSPASWRRRSRRRRAGSENATA